MNKCLCCGQSIKYVKGRIYSVENSTLPEDVPEGIMGIHYFSDGAKIPAVLRYTGIKYGVKYGVDTKPVTLTGFSY